MTTSAIEKELFQHDMAFSKDIGVGDPVLSKSNQYVDWVGTFDAKINDRIFHMQLTPSTLFINHVDPSAPIALKVGSEWIDTPFGNLFHASYVTSEIQGGFQIFRSETGRPFPGFEQSPHSHMLLFTDRNNEKHYVPIQIEFSTERQ